MLLGFVCVFKRLSVFIKCVHFVEVIGLVYDPSHVSCSGLSACCSYFVKLLATFDYKQKYYSKNVRIVLLISHASQEW